MFQNLFNLHREFAFDEVIINERRIAESFQYRPSLLPNIEKLRFSPHSTITNNEKNRLTFAATPTPKTFIPTSTSFSNRADIEAFQHKKESIQSIESNEIDLTKLIRETYANNTYRIQIYILSFAKSFYIDLNHLNFLKYQKIGNNNKNQLLHLRKKFPNEQYHVMMLYLLVLINDLFFFII
jgi:hypothetical protein